MQRRGLNIYNVSHDSLKCLDCPPKKQWKSETKESHPLSPSVKSNRQKSSGSNQLKWDDLDRAHHKTLNIILTN